MMRLSGPIRGAIRNRVGMRSKARDLYRAGVMGTCMIQSFLGRVRVVCTSSFISAKQS